MSPLEINKRETLFLLFFSPKVFSGVETKARPCNGERKEGKETHLVECLRCHNYILRSSGEVFPLARDSIGTFIFCHFSKDYIELYKRPGDCLCKRAILRDTHSIFVLN